MAQISRPIQIAFVAVLLVAGVALFALKGGSSSTSTGAGSPAPAPASKPSSPASKSSAKDNLPTAPGVAGLTRAIEKAHGAVATSQQNARQLEQKAQEASSNAAKSGGATAPAAPSTSSAAPTTTAPSSSKTASPSKHASGVSGKQRAVEAELAAGDVVVILFWDRKGADDVAVHGVVTHAAGFGVDVHVSTASQVAKYGAVTRGVQIYGTPTTLVVGRNGKAKVLTGLTDDYSLRQAISEAITG